MDGTIAIIGAGHMGGAFYRGLAAKIGSDRIWLCDHHREKLEAAGAAHATTEADEAVGNADTVILAVKPQAFEQIAEDMGTPIERKIVISLMAGIPIARLTKTLGTTAVVRAMPNLGAQVGRGMTAWVAHDDLTQEQRDGVEAIFRAVGEEMELVNEAMLDPYTALAGSGPAYFFVLCDLLQKDAERLGFGEEEARMIARETLAGSSAVLEGSPLEAGEWIDAVASPGGTTEAALHVLRDGPFHDALTKAINAACKRSKELSQA